MITDNTFKFNSNGKLRILQVSDPQDLKFVRKSMVRMLDRAYDRLKPDIVVFTGDNILGNHLLDRRIGTKPAAYGYEAALDSMKKALDFILEPVSRRRIPFAMIYGNHDDMNEVTKEEQADIYRGYAGSFPMNTENKDIDCDTYVIKLYNTDGKLCGALFMIDTAWQDKDEERNCHSEIKKEAVEWYKKETQKMREENAGEDVPALMFLHIPLKEQFNIVTDCDKNDPDAFICRDGCYRKLDKSRATGIMKEEPSVLETDNGMFEAIKALGNIKAVITGHDHTNCFTGKVDGVEFIQTGAASFRCYGNSLTRGVRVIDLDETGNYTTEFYTFFDLCGDNAITRIENFLDADEFEKKKFTALGVIAVMSLTGLTARIIKSLKK
ncbi:MAG: metallophosphoesterase [Clostridia bacterium]|nr:metallophosphoesterase [Clostridia bacterium]